MNKFQQGGVFNPITVNTPDVGGINASPIIDIPVPPPINLPGMANLAIDAERRRRQLDQDSVAQQGKLDASVKEFRSLQDALVGEVHNPYQAKLLEAAKKRHNIDDDFYSSVDFNNINDVKAHTNKIYEYINDKDVLEVMGQVEVANKLRTMSPANMTKEEQDAWMEANKAYEGATVKEQSDPRIVDPRRYNLATPKADPRPKYGTVIQSYLTQVGKTVDLTDPNEQSRVSRTTADQIALNYGEAAVKEGIIIYPPGGNRAQLTPLGQAMVNDAIGVIQQDYTGKREDRVEDATTMAQTRDEIGDANRAEAARIAKEKADAKKTTSTKTPKQIEEARNYWDKALSYSTELDNDYGWIKVEDYPWLMDKIATLTESSAASNTPADKAKELYKLVDRYFADHPEQDPRNKQVGSTKPAGPPELNVTIDKTGPKTIKKDANGKIIY